MAIGNNVLNGQAQSRYSVVNESRRALERLADLCEHLLPQDVLQNVKNVDFVPSPTGDRVYFPCPLKEVETTAAIKALEGAVAAAIADLQDGRKPRTVSVDIDKIACFLMSTYLTTVDGLGKMDPDVKFKLIGQSTNRSWVLKPLVEAGEEESKIDSEPLRHGPQPGAVNLVQAPVRKPIRDKDAGRVLSHTRLPGRYQDAADARAAGLPAKSH